MGNVLKIIAMVILGIIAFKLAIGLVSGILHTLFSLLIPVAVLAGIVYVLYQMSGKKSLGGGGRSLP